MRYLLLVKATDEYEAGDLPDQNTLAEMAKWNEALVKSGSMLACERLQPSAQGTRVCKAGRKITVTDGPFAETKELIAGTCLIESRSLEEAVDWAKRIPFKDGEVEVRPLLALFEDQSPSTSPPARKPGTVGYMAFIKSDSEIEAGKLPDEKAIADMTVFLEEGARAGIFLSGEGLQPSSKSARVRYSGSQRTVIDGPFAETKELVAGYCSLQFASKTDAIEWAKQFVQVDAPGRYREQCECEIRPIFKFEDFGTDVVEMFRQGPATA